MTVLETEKFRCKFCGEWSEVDPADQEAPADFCHPEDHVGLLTHDVVMAECPRQLEMKIWQLKK